MVRAGGEEASAVPTAVVAKEKFVRRITAEGNLKAVNATPSRRRRRAAGRGR